MQRTVAASAAQAYAGLTDPAMLSRWFAQEARADLKVGGRYENSDGGAGEFLFLDPPRRLKFTWEHRVHCPGTVVEIEILPKEGHRATIRVTHSRLKSEGDFREMKERWSRALDALKSFLVGVRTTQAHWRERGAQG